mmetsp:Transcript_77767/g.224820  ORF Transcript_77767/g.224820 Transcript_77767/m.224820 type:complete len:236 (+) Transcript_77767:811-1518(+)
MHTPEPALRATAATSPGPDAGSLAIRSGRGTWPRSASAGAKRQPNAIVRGCTSTLRGSARGCETRLARRRSAPNGRRRRQRGPCTPGTELPRSAGPRSSAGAAAACARQRIVAPEILRSRPRGRRWQRLARQSRILSGGCPHSGERRAGRRSARKRPRRRLLSVYREPSVPGRRPLLSPGAERSQASSFGQPPQFSPRLWRPRRRRRPALQRRSRPRWPRSCGGRRSPPATQLRR